MFSRFGISMILTLAASGVALLMFGVSGLMTTIILIAIELAFSFDNAVVNAKILEKLSKKWQKLFLTLGTLISVVGVRFVFPVFIVMITANLSWSRVLDDALHHPQIYGEHLTAAHPLIASFGGSFLMVLSLYFFFDTAKRELWLKGIEEPLQKIKGATWMPPIITTLVVVALSRSISEHGDKVLKAGLIGVAAYVIMQMVINGLAKIAPSGGKHYTGWAAFVAFMYLQLLNASFSLDGVLGAFAITDKIILIMLGLGIGALWAAVMTVYFVESGVIGTYKYLEHGAHYAILVLSIALFTSLFIEIPDVITGIVGIGIILSSFIASREALRSKH